MQVIAATKVQLVDTVGVILAGLDEAPTRAVRSLAAEEDDGRKDSSLPAPVTLAMVLGTAAHANDYDNSHLPSLMHPSGVMVPAALAAARANTSGASVLSAMALGQEVALRLGVIACQNGTGNSELFERGLHPTSVCCAVGAAMAAGLLLDLDIERLADALGIACSFASGILEGNRTGGSVKPLHSGWAASAGLQAARLAYAGVTAPPTAIEGRFGFVHAFMGATPDPWDMLRDLGKTWETSRIGVKAYPTNGFTHTSIEAALDLRQRGVRGEQIDDVVLGVAAPTVRTIGEPTESKIRPASGYAARFSGPFTFAAALRGGAGLGLSLADVSDSATQDQSVLAIAEKVHVEGDAECTAAFPSHTPCTATVTLNDGTRMISHVETPRGSVERPLTKDELHSKFVDCATTVLKLEKAEELLHDLTDLETLPAVAHISRLLYLGDTR